MSAPTQGPYRVDPRAAFRIMAGKDDTIATTGLQGDLRDQWEANAILLAASWDMRKTLRPALLRLVSEHVPLFKTQLLELAEKQEAAIAKANGAA